MAVKRSTVLIDGDLLLYKFGFRGQSEFDFGGDEKAVWLEEQEMKAQMDSFIKGIQTATRSPFYWVCLTGEANFRYELLPTYKHNRKDSVKPLLYGKLKAHLMENHPVKSLPRLEADDVMGIMSTYNKEKYVIASYDKDLEQIPGWLYNWNKDAAPRYVELVDADYFFFKQILKGDPVDGYSGCPGIGEKKASQLLPPYHECGNPPHQEWLRNLWSIIVNVYSLKGLPESYVEKQAQMARILRAEDYDFKKKEIIYWRFDKALT